MLSFVVAKLQKLIEQHLLEHVPPGGSKWASPIVVLRKSDGDIRICGDCKIGINHKVCSDSYPISNVEVAFHALAGMACHPTPIHNNFKEVTTINTPIGSLKWRRMPYGIETVSEIFQRTSEHSISGILSQEEHPIMYTEIHYSNIEKEALAIVWTTTRARQILLEKNLF